MKKNRKRFYTDNKYKVLCIVSIIILCFVFSLCVGRYSKIDIFDIPSILIHQFLPAANTVWSYVDESIIINLRFPRIIAAIVVGASLAIAGVSYQSIFSNPIASSDTLGISSSASFGAVLGILLNFNTIGVKLVAFIFGCCSVLSVLFLAKKLSNGKNITVFLILIGMVLSSIFSSLLSIVKYVADPIDKLPKITYWLMGSLSNVRATDLPFCIGIFLIGVVPIFMMKWRMNLLLLSDYEAKSIGENINILRTIIVICSTLLTSSAVGPMSILWTQKVELFSLYKIYREGCFLSC